MAAMRIDTARRSVSLDPVDPDFFNNPYPAYHAIRAAVPVFKWEQYGYWCFARHEDVNALLRDRRFGRQILHVASREELGWPETPPHLKPFYDFESHSLLELEPPVHTRLRSLVNRSFLSRQVERLRPMITNLSNGLIDRFETAHEADLLPAFATPIPVIVICELLGVPPDMSRQLLAWSHDMVAMYQARRDAAIEEAAVKATIAFSDFMRGYIAQRRKEPRDDLLSELIRAEEQGAKLSEDELVTTAILLLNAGHEATVHAIGNGIKCLLEHDVRDGIGEGHIEETLAIRCAAAPVHPLCAGRPRLRGDQVQEGRDRGADAGCRQPRSRALSRAGPVHSGARHPTRRSASAPASTSASARRWRGSKCRSPCRSCSSACRSSGWRNSPATATPITSTGLRA